MASISKDKNGTKRIVYYNTSKKQVSIRLGKIPMKNAETIKVHVENLLSAQASKVSVATETAEWLSKIPDQLYEKFVQKGFVPPRRVVGTLGEMIPRVIKEKSVDSKPASVEIFRQTERCLYEYFDKNKGVDSITETDAKEFKQWLAKKGSFKTSSPLKPTTVAKRMQHVSSFFHKMKEDGDIPRNPFRKLAKKATVDKTRNRYIDEKTILQVMEYAPDAEWRLIIALWRFAGLRAVSEVLMLKWEDILWDQKKIVVHSPKTEQHEGKDVRVIPFFPHLEECLTEAFEQADEGAVYVVEKHAPLYLRGKKERVYVSRQGNIGTTFRKIILRAGLVPWDKLIQNLRASFETDLLNGKYGKFGLHTIAAWLGHSVKVMLEHYGRFQQSDFDQIAEACEQVREQKAQTMSQKDAHSDCFFLENAGLTAENLTSIPTSKASLYRAVRGEIGGNRAETPSYTNSTHVLENKEHEGNKRHSEEHDVNCPNSIHGWRGIRQGSRNPLQDKGLRKIEKSLAQKAAHFGKVVSKLLKVWNFLTSLQAGHLFPQTSARLFCFLSNSMSSTGQMTIRARTVADPLHRHLSLFWNGEFLPLASGIEEHLL